MDYSEQNVGQDVTPEVSTDLIPDRTEQEVADYNRIKRNVHLADIGISVAYWIIGCVVATGLFHGLRLGEMHQWWALVVMAVLLIGGSAIVSLPLSYYSGYLVEKRYGLSNQTTGAWIVFQIKTWLVGAVLGGIVLGGLYAALWYAGGLWSVWVWVGVMLFSVGLAKLFPLVILPLFYPARPLDRPDLIQRLKSLAGDAGMKITGIYDLALSKDTKKANAMLAGLGSSRRVYLSDTLLNAFNEDEIGVVFTHELGHHIRGHIWKLIGMSAVVTSIMVALIHWRLDPFEGMGNPDAERWHGAVIALAQVMLIATVYPLLIGPITNGISRRFEREADADALRLTDDPESYRSAFERLGKLNLEDPDPPRWEVILFENHPPLAERVAMAQEASERST